MRLCIKLALCFVFALTSVVYLFIHNLSNASVDIRNNPHNGSFKAEVAMEYRRVWVTFTKAPSNGGLLYKFESMLESIIVQSHGVPIHLNIITDVNSKDIASNVLDRMINLYSPNLISSFYNIDWCADKIRDIIDCMRPHFSSQPGSYYSDALFFLSLGLHRIAPANQQEAIMLDCDLRFKTSIDLLFDEFKRFSPTTLFGLSHEMSSVYRHILYNYRMKNLNTPFGSEVNFNKKKIKKPSDEEVLNNFILEQNMNSANNYSEDDKLLQKKDILYNKLTNQIKKGFPGYNSGVILMNFDRIRKSQLYKKVLSCDFVNNITEKYLFKGHLGDQDFFTLLGYEEPTIFKTLDCGWNRQLCKWWRRYEDISIFDDYFKCDSDIKVYHGNCNTQIPSR